jgi:hypothetical protein
MTSAWCLEAPPQACWQLIADARRWPRWWRSISELGELPRQIEHPGRPRAWRALLGLPLRLRAGQGVSSPRQLIEWHIRGDIHARLTWVLASTAPGCCDVTCRWEIEPLFGGPDGLRSLVWLLLERSHFGRMRACAMDMGAALGCRSTRLREWSGLTHR